MKVIWRVVNAEGNLPCFQPQFGQFPFSASTASWQTLPVTKKRKLIVFVAERWQTQSIWPQRPSIHFIVFVNTFCSHFEHINTLSVCFKAPIQPENMDLID